MIGIVNEFVSGHHVTKRFGEFVNFVQPKVKKGLDEIKKISTLAEVGSTLDGCMWPADFWKQLDAANAPAAPPAPVAPAPPAPDAK